MTSWRKSLIFLAVLFPALAIGSWLFAGQAASFDTAKSFAEANPEVQLQIGQVREVSLPIFGYSIKRNGGAGDASYTLNLTGERGSATINVQLAYRGSWSVASATLATPSGPIRLQVPD